MSDRYCLLLAIWVFLGVDPQAGGSFTWAALFNRSNLHRGSAYRALRIPFCHRVVAVNRRNRFVIKSDFRHDYCHVASDVPYISHIGLDRAHIRLIALSVAAVVCIASSNGGTTSQDLKTGYLVGATPKYQQLGILVGAVSSALVIGVILMVLNRSGTIYSANNLPQPAAH